jgi:hypothetical protein
MYDTARQHRRRSGRRPLVRRLLHNILPHPRVLDPYTSHQESVRPERRHERQRQKIAILIRGVIVFLIGLAIAIALVHENGPHAASPGDMPDSFQGSIPVPPSGSQPQP